MAPLLVLAYLGFISLGLPDGLLGVGWPSTAGDLGVPVAAVGFVLTAFTAGYLSASVAAGFILARTGVGELLAASTALASLALLGYGLAPALAVAAGCALLLGVGSGAVDSGLNAYAAEHFSARHMNWMHAFFGLGGTAGPLVMTAVLSAGLAWRWGYAVVGLAQAGLAGAFALTVRAWRDGARGGSRVPADAPAVAAPVVVPGRSTLLMPKVWLGVLLFGIYTAVEVAAGLWAYLLLTEARGVSPGVAGGCVSAFWASLFAGRLCYGIVAGRLRTGRVLIVCMVVIGIGAGLLSVPGTAWPAVAGLILLGGFAAPVFPLLTLTTAERVGERHAARAIGLQMGAAGLGGTAIPAGIGVLMGRYGADVLGGALVVLVLLTIGVYTLAVRR